MLLTKLLLSLILCLAYVGADAESSPKRSLEDWETLVEKLESRLRKLETRVDDEERKLEAKDKEMEMRLEELEVKIKEGEKREVELEASMSKLKKEVEESLRKEIVANLANNTLEKPSLRDLPIVLISAWRADELKSPQTVTFDSFLTNFDNADRPGGGSGVLDLDSGLFTCFTPGYYTIPSPSLHMLVRGPTTPTRICSCTRMACSFPKVTGTGGKTVMSSMTTLE